MRSLFKLDSQSKVLLVGHLSVGLVGLHWNTVTFIKKAFGLTSIMYLESMSKGANDFISKPVESFLFAKIENIFRRQKTIKKIYFLGLYQKI